MLHINDAAIATIATITSRSAILGRTATTTPTPTCAADTTIKACRQRRCTTRRTGTTQTPEVLNRWIARTAVTARTGAGNSLSVQLTTARTARTAISYCVCNTNPTTRTAAAARIAPKASAAVYLVTTAARSSRPDNRPDASAIIRIAAHSRRTANA
jgi:hypothetical protein